VLTNTVVPPIGELVDQLPEAAARQRVDARGRLVEEQDRRLVQHRAAERQALLPAERQLAGQRFGRCP
jgi:hypothetical protein